jgi:Lar family restriction alleviation protein
MNELHRCPFCGGEASLDVGPAYPAQGTSPTWDVWCTTCEIQTKQHATAEAVVANWNRRTVNQLVGILTAACLAAHDLWKNELATMQDFEAVRDQLEKALAMAAQESKP